MPQPYISNNNILDLSFVINGQNNGLHTLFKEGWIQFEINKVAMAKFSFVATNLSTDTEEKQAINDLELHAQQASPEIEVTVSINQEKKTIFKGFIKSYNKQINPHTTEIKIECKDIAFELTKQSNSFGNATTFEDVLQFNTQALNIDVIGLDTVIGKDTMITPHNNSSVWDYLISYLDTLGYWVCIENGKLKIFDTTQAEATKYIAEQGINVFAYNARTEPQRKKSKVSIASWDIENQEVNTIEVTQNVNTNEEILRINNSNFSISTLERMAKAKLTRSNICSIYGNVLTFGNLEASIGDYIELQKAEESIDNKAMLITKAIHQFENGNWKTEFNYGQEQENSFLETLNGNRQDTQTRTGLNNSLQGLQIGIVLQIEDDPDNLYRIKVQLPMLAPDTDGVWARLTHIYASNDMGSFFIPDVGDEVIIACLDNNPDSPIILGSLYNPKNSPPESIDVNNDIKGFVTKEGTKIIFKESEKSIELSNVSGDKILISDQKKGIQIIDQNGNTIQMDSNGIALKSNSDIKIETASSLTIKSSSIKVESSGILELKGSLIKLN